MFVWLMLKHCSSESNDKTKTATTTTNDFKMTVKWQKAIEQKKNDCEKRGNKKHICPMEMHIQQSIGCNLHNNMTDKCMQLHIVLCISLGWIQHTSTWKYFPDIRINEYIFFLFLIKFIAIQEIDKFIWMQEHIF